MENFVRLAGTYHRTKVSTSFPSLQIFVKEKFVTNSSTYYKVRHLSGIKQSKSKTTVYKSVYGQKKKKTIMFTL